MPKREATEAQRALRIDEVGDYVSARRAAEMLGVSLPAVTQLVHRGQLDVRYWAGMTLMVSRASIDAYRADPPFRRGPMRGAGGRPRKTEIGNSEART